MGNGGACAVHALSDLGRNDLFPADGSSRGIRPANVFHHIRSVACDRAGGSRKGKSDFIKRVVLATQGLDHVEPLNIAGRRLGLALLWLIAGAYCSYMVWRIQAVELNSF